MNERRDADTGWSWWYLLFLVQFVSLLWPAFYNKLEPTLIGIPFFYWYQLPLGDHRRGSDRHRLFRDRGERAECSCLQSAPRSAYGCDPRRRPGKKQKIGGRPCMT